MNPQSNKKGITVAVAIVVLVLIGIAFYSLYKNDSSTNTAPLADNSAPSQSTLAQIVTVKHQYKDGTHTYAGTIDLPTPCQRLTQSVVKDPTIKNKFTIAFVVSNDPDSTVCAQVVTSRQFKVSFAGPQNAIVGATLNGQALQWNVFDVGPNENLDSFQINIKG